MSGKLTRDVPHTLVIDDLGPDGLDAQILHPDCCPTKEVPTCDKGEISIDSYTEFLCLTGSMVS